MTTNVQINLDFPSGVTIDGDFAGAYSDAGGVAGAANATSITVQATDSAGAPPTWHLRFQYSGYPSHRTSIKMAIPAGPLSFTVYASALSSLSFTQDANWTATFPSGIPAGTQVTVAGAGLPAGLTAGTYYVVTTALGSVSLSATAGGSAVTCTSTGSGTMTVTAYNYSALLTAYNSRNTTNPASLPYPGGTATQGYEITADDNGNPVWTATPGTTYNRLTPADMGVLAWTYPPHEYTTALGLRAGNGWFYAFRFKTGAACTVNNILYVNTVAATGTAMANVFLGIYDDTGTLLGQCTVDQVTNMTSAAGAKTAALSAPLTLAANTVYRIGLCVGTAAGTTQPSLASGAASSSGAFNNLGVPAAKTVGVASQNSYSSLPSPITFSSLGAQAGLPVFVLT